MKSLHHLTLLIFLLCFLTSAFDTQPYLAVQDASNNQAYEQTTTALPVISTSFADPCIIKVGTTWYAFATRIIGCKVHFQVASSPDFTNWTIATDRNGAQIDALPILPAWVNPINFNTWAPDVSQLSDGTFVMYFAATTAAPPSARFHCIGAATSANVEGPYVGQPNSLICPLSEGGAIDPDGFRDPGTGQRYIIYKVDGNSIGHGGACGNTRTPLISTSLMLQAVSADGYTLQGPPIELLNHNGSPDDGIIEAPTLTCSVAGTYVLFFSSGCFTTPHYTVSYATSKNVTGPYTRQPVPLFVTGTNGLKAPGSCDVWDDAKHMVFHAGIGVRPMYTALIDVQGTVVTQIRSTASSTASTSEITTSTSASTAAAFTTSSTISS